MMKQMKKPTLIKIGSVCLLFSLIFSTPLLFGIKLTKATKASLIWGTTDNMTEAEITASSGACGAINAYFDYNADYDLLGNYYGSETQQSTTLGNVSLVEDDYDYGTVFYKGHTFFATLHGHKHDFLYDDDGGSSTDRIYDFGVGYRTSNGEHDFVFIWSCNTADYIGDVSGSPPHTWGFAASWMGTESLNENGYEETSDYGPNAYIGFQNVSKPMVESTGYNGWSYRYWATYFYLYLLRDGMDIKEALDAASEITIGSEFGDTDLYTGYEVYEYGEWWDSKMGVYGNGDITLPT